jgi:hypothetical protein
MLLDYAAPTRNDLFIIVFQLRAKSSARVQSAPGTVRASDQKEQA